MMLGGCESLADLKEGISGVYLRDPRFAVAFFHIDTSET
jgi:hypothetical protein